MGGNDRRSITINNSSAKQQFLFSKQSRFPSHKAHTTAIAYDLNGYFGDKRGSNAGRGFSSSEKRFLSHKNNSAAKIDGPGQYDR